MAEFAKFLRSKIKSKTVRKLHKTDVNIVYVNVYL